MWRDTEITQKRILKWLAAGRTLKDAQDEAALMSAEEKWDLSKWVRTAFWRRTSKLGIDFTTGRGHIIHFNVSSDPNWVPGQPFNMKKGGLKKVTGTYGRMITTSEYHHVTKQIERGNISKDLVNFYDEW